ncbi:hypothetical protein ACIQKE_12230 [Streptomyces griseoviridis]
MLRKVGTGIDCQSGADTKGISMLRGGDLSPSVADAVVFSRLARRRHIDLRLVANCLCQGFPSSTG